MCTSSSTLIVQFEEYGKYFEEFAGIREGFVRNVEVFEVFEAGSYEQPETENRDLVMCLVPSTPIVQLEEKGSYFEQFVEI